MRFLLFSAALLLISCASEYKALEKGPVDLVCVEKIKPRGISTSWYDAGIDVLDKHISGLLLIKVMPDSVTRIVFTNEAGVTYFDMAFDASGNFKSHYVMRQLNKKPVVQTLKADFELLLGIPFREASLQAWQRGEEVFYGVQQKKKTAYFITGPDCASLHRLEWGSKGKKMVAEVLMGNSILMPDSVLIQHHTFAMYISLKKLEKE